MHYLSFNRRYYRNDNIKMIQYNHMIKIYKKIYDYFDILEDKIRAKLTHFPLIYALIGSITIISIWRGIWEVSDQLGIPGWLSIAGGISIAMLCGLFVSFFIGENIIISGINKEKRIDEKTEKEIKEEENILKEIQMDVKEVKEILKNKKDK